MEMCFHGNQLSWAIKYPVISLYLKYHSPGFIRFPTMLAPVFSSLDEIYCIKNQMNDFNLQFSCWEYAIHAIHFNKFKYVSMNFNMYTNTFGNTEKNMSIERRFQKKLCLDLGQGQFVSISRCCTYNEISIIVSSTQTL